MNKKFIIRKNEEIVDIVKTGKKLINKYYVIYIKDNNLSYNRFCVSVSKKIGKANVRNLYKRKIKDILLKNKIDKNNDYVIILRNLVVGSSYEKLKNELLELLKGKIYEKEF